MTAHDLPLELLTVHPLLEPLPPLALDVPEMLALIESIELHGVLRPVVVNDRHEIMSDDGRSQVRAALKAGLKFVPCAVAPDEDAASIILSSLCGYRHLTKSALAYLAFPLMEAGRDARLARRTANLKSGAKSRTSNLFPFGETVEVLADRLGFSKQYFYQAREVHGLFTKRPDLKAALEPRLLSGELTLHTVRTVANNYADAELANAKLDKRAEHGRLVAELFKRASHHFRQWEQLDLFQREQAIEAVAKTVAEWPEEVRLAIRKAAKDVKPQSI